MPSSQNDRSEARVKVLYRGGTPRYLTVTELRQRVYAAVREGTKRHTFSAADADDITQDLMVRALVSKRFRWGWIRAHCEREAFRLRKARQREVTLHDDIVDPADPLAQVLEDDLCGAIVSALSSNPSIHARAASELVQHGPEAFIEFVRGYCAEARAAGDRRYRRRPYLRAFWTKARRLIDATGVLKGDSSSFDLLSLIRAAARTTKHKALSQIAVPGRRPAKRAKYVRKASELAPSLVGKHPKEAA